MRYVWKLDQSDPTSIYTMSSWKVCPIIAYYNLEVRLQSRTKLPFPLYPGSRGAEQGSFFSCLALFLGFDSAKFESAEGQLLDAHLSTDVSGDWGPGSSH